MAIRIKFDSNHNVITPIFALATRNGTKLGVVPAFNISMSDSFNSYFELDFQVHKYLDGQKYHLWDELTSLKLLWCKDWDVWFEISVEIQSDDSDVKNVHCVSLGEAELSQVNLYNIEINTEDDILRDDYVPTVLFDETDAEDSLLNRIMDKMPHYSIEHVDSTIASIQRTFSFHNISIYDAMQEIASEIDCIFIFHSGSNSDGSIKRSISVYDLESYCVDCGTRGNFSSQCSECKGTNILHGYGDDTTIFISRDNLADSITFKTDVDSVKNCFRLEAGDDFMTATVRNCNPNGSGYLWDFSPEIKNDMSENLRNKLDDYDVQYEYYMKEHTVAVDSEILNRYNEIIDKYIAYDDNLKKIPASIVGYSSLMNAYYDTVDAYLILHDSMMPVHELPDTTASNEASKLTNASLSPVAVQSLDSCSATTVSSAVLNMAKVLVDSRYKISVGTGSINKTENEEGAVTGVIWTGNFEIESYTDEEDSATTSNISVSISDDLEEYTKQKLDKALSNSISEDANGIVDLFDLSLDRFINEIKKYCLDSLNTFHDSCQTCLNILIEQGIANADEWEGKTPDLYNDLYIPYYEKLFALEDEILVRENDLYVINAKYDSDGNIVKDGMQSTLDRIRLAIQDILNTEVFLGEDLWHELISYRREDTYSNDNYISDGLDNSALFNRALEFIDAAKKEIYKSSHLQHSISASLKNLLVMKEFEPLLDYFSTGNWLRIDVDGNIYKLRLLYYAIQFDSIDDIDVEFSDVTKCADGISDSESILDQAASMAKGYGEVTKQANQGQKGKEQLDNWVKKGLSLTTLKIVGTSDNIDVSVDKHGMVFKEWLPITETYDDRQLKIINKGLYITSDNWKTARAGIGNFMFYNPITGQTEEAYGVIADTLVGNLILSEKVGIYNSNSNIVIDENGITITADNTYQDEDDVLTTFQLQKKHFDEEGNEVISKLLYIDERGDLVLNGSLRINTGDEEDKTLEDAFDDSRFDEKIESTVSNKYDSINGTISERTNAVLQEALDELERYKAEVGQYLTFGKDEGLTIGANANGIESSFKTTLDNRRLAFKENDITVAYISNSQLNILNAIVRNAFILGKVVFMPRKDEDGNPTGVSVVWNEDFVESLEKEYSIVTQPVSQSVNAGGTVTFTCTSSDSGQTYYWQISKDGGDTWENYSSGSNRLSYTTTSMDENGYLFRCYARYEDGQIVISEAATLTVVDTSELYIVTQPQSVTVESGQDATFSVKTSKSTSTEHVYKWEYSTDDKSTWKTHSTHTVQNNTSQITFSNVGDDLDGAYVRCTVTCTINGGKQTVTTNGNARIEISISGGGAVQDSEITITSHPQNITITPNQTATFTGSAQTTASGVNMTYKWMYTEGGSSKWIDGGTGQTFSIADSGGDAHNRKVKFIADDGINTLESDVAIITVQSTITIETQPQSITIDEDGKASFSVSASTDATSKSLSYSWKYKTADSDEWISSGSLSTVTYTDNSGNFNGCLVKCEIRDEISVIETDVAEITVVIPTLKIINDLPDITIATGEEAYLDIEVESTISGATIMYSWYGKYANESSWTSYGTDEYNEFELTDSNRNLNGFQVKCTVNDGTTVVNSRVATITVLDPSMITKIVTQPDNVTVNLLDTATFSIEATGQDLTYKWEYKKIGGTSSSWTSFGSSATASKNITDANYDRANVRCTVTGADGASVVSDTAYIYVNPTDSAEITITTQPESSLKVARGDNISLSVAASGSGLTYQWQSKIMTQYTINSEFSNISGATSSTYTGVASTSTLVKSQYIRCVIRDSSGNVHVSNACQITFS